MVEIRKWVRKEALLKPEYRVLLTVASNEVEVKNRVCRPRAKKCHPSILQDPLVTPVIFCNSDRAGRGWSEGGWV